MPEVRCEQNKLFGIVSEGSAGIFEAVCNSRFCQRQPGKEVTLHIWNLEKVSEDGIIKPINTRRFKKPEVRGKK